MSDDGDLIANGNCSLFDSGAAILVANLAKKKLKKHFNIIEITKVQFDLK
jgi:hypothetical protein